MSTRKMLGVGGKTERCRTVLAENWFAYLLILPVLLFLVLLMWLPFLQGIYMSFNEWPFGGDPTWIGLGNYEFLFSWDPFFTSLKATLIFSLTTLFQLIVALAAALAVRELRRGRASSAECSCSPTRCRRW